MRAAVFKQVGRPLVIESVADPEPGHGQVVLKVGRCGICGTDLHMTDGSGQCVPAGSVLGHEFAGEVAAVGPGVSRLRVGDCVTALPMTGCGQCPSCRAGYFNWCTDFNWRPGGYAEYVVAGEGSCIQLPRALSLADGALVEPLAVALHSVKMAQIRPDTRVLVLGAGPIGLAAMYWARRFGAMTVLGTATSMKRAALAHTMGATDFFANDEEALARANQQGGLADIVIEAVGLPGMIARAIDLVKPRGTVISAGFCMQTDHFNPVLATVKEVQLRFSILYGIEDFQQSVDALEAGHVEPRAMITDTVSLHDFPAAFESLRARNHQCKVMLDPWLSHETTRG